MEPFAFLSPLVPKFVTPNHLSWFRIWIVPFIWLTYLAHPFISFLIYAIACISAGLDGYLARKRRVFEPNGKRLDEVSDKVLALGTVALLMAVGLIPFHPESVLFYCIAAIVVRECIVTTLREVWPEKAATIPSLFLAKLKTFLLMPGLGLLMLGTLESNVFGALAFTGIVLIFAATALAVVSGVQYIYRFLTTAP